MRKKIMILQIKKVILVLMRSLIKIKLKKIVIILISFESILNFIIEKLILDLNNCQFQKKKKLSYN